MDLIDTHQHLILRDRLGYAWTRGIPALAQRSFTPLDYAAERRGRRVAASIVMECAVDDADWRREARIVAGLVGRDGIVGQVASCRPESDEGFEAWLDEGPSLGVLGYRRVLHVVPDAVAMDPTLRRNLKALGRRGLPFDLCFHARQLGGPALDLVRDCDGQALVLDHCGCPEIGAGGFGPWARDVAALARHEHLACKLSGLTAYCAPGPHDAATLLPYVEHVLDRFGPDRVMWGSDWPVADLGAGLAGWMDLTAELLAGLSQDERDRVAQGTARRVYRPPL